MDGNVISAVWNITQLENAQVATDRRADEKGLTAYSHNETFYEWDEPHSAMHSTVNELPEHNVD